MQQNLIEKIAQKHAVNLAAGTVLRSGDYATIQPAHVLTHDNTSAVIPKFLALGEGLERVAFPRQIVFALDHNIQDRSEKTLKKYEMIREFAAARGIAFYPAGRGIGHQVMCEEGYAWPGTLVVAADSHANIYGGLGCLGTPIVRTDAAAIWATGRTWWQVPPVARVELTGCLRPGVSGKDVIIGLCGLFDRDEVLNHAIEFTGDGVGSLTVEQRLTIANMTTEWGALAGLFPVDERTIEWLRKRQAEERIKGIDLAALEPDPGAEYSVEIRLDLAALEPRVAGPDSVKVVTPVSELSRRKITIQKAYILSCVNGRVEDLSAAARVLAGRKVSAGVELYIAAASSVVQAESEARGDWQVLLEAGAIPLPAGCGPCIGLGKGVLEDGEVGISATNRNFKGRMGSRDAQVYLASPAVVAASAVAGRIEDPDALDGGIAVQGRPKGEAGGITRRSGPPRRSAPVSLVAGFPEQIEAELVFCHQDNLNTDGIYPGKYTYIDDFTPEQQAGVVMENYDPRFGQLVKEGDILVAGFNFGTGSSREQAATALKHRGIRLVVAGSLSETYKRNAINNGFLAVEAPGLVRDLKAQFGTRQLTIRTGIVARLLAARSLIETRSRDGKTRTHAITPVGAAAQELILAGGIAGWVRKQLGAR